MGAAYPKRQRHWQLGTTPKAPMAAWGPLQLAVEQNGMHVGGPNPAMHPHVQLGVTPVTKEARRLQS